MNRLQGALEVHLVDDTEHVRHRRVYGKWFVGGRGNFIVVESHKVMEA